MKKLSIFLITIIAFIGFTSCEHDDDVVFVAQPDPMGIDFTVNLSGNYILTAQTEPNLAERFVWNEVSFDAPTTVTYELQGSSEADFSAFDVIGTTSETNLGVTVGQMMDLAEDAGYDNDPNTEAPNSGPLYFRVRAFAGTDGSNGISQESDIVSITVTLPEVGEEEGPKTNLFLVGDATAAGWNPNNNNTAMFRDPANDDLFYYTGYFNAGFVKFLEGAAWAPQYGSENGTDLIYRATEADPDPPAIEITTAGYYSITVDLDSMTFSISSYDASGADTYSTIGYIGTATPGGWDADTDMTQSSHNPHLWYANDIALAEGEMKFRANDAWDVNWGADTAISGQATVNGPNIPVEEGTYDIWFNDLTGSYILVPIVEE